jgi:hypothetical protein
LGLKQRKNDYELAPLVNRRFVSFIDFLSSNFKINRHESLHEIYRTSRNFIEHNSGFFL